MVAHTCYDAYEMLKTRLVQCIRSMEGQVEKGDFTDKNGHKLTNNQAYDRLVKLREVYDNGDPSIPVS